MSNNTFPRTLQYYKFCAYGFLKNLRFFDPFIILFFTEKGFNFFEIGTLVSIREVVIQIMEIPSGIIADALGRRYAMIFSFVSYIISFVLFYVYNYYMLYVIAMIFFAFGEAFRSGTHKAMIFEYLKIENIEEHKVAYYGHTRGVAQIGSAVSSLIAALIVYTTEHYSMVFLFSTIPYLLNLLLLLSYPKRLDGNIRIADANSAFPKIWKEVIMTVSSTLHVLRSRKRITAIVNGSFFEAVFKIVKDYVQPVIVSYALLIPFLGALPEEKRSSIWIGVVYFVIFIFAGLASRSASAFTAKVRPLTRAIDMLMLGGSIVLIFAGIMYWNRLYLFTIFLFLVVYMVYNLKKPLNVSLLGEIIDSNVMATCISAESQFKSLLVALCAPLFGYVVDSGGIGAGLLAVGVVTLISFPLVAVHRKVVYNSQNN